jgi:hypothetical protein
MELNARLAFDALQSTNRYIFFWVRNRNAPTSARVLELNVAAGSGCLVPAVPLKHFDDCAAIHSVY